MSTQFPVQKFQQPLLRHSSSFDVVPEFSYYPTDPPNALTPTPDQAPTLPDWRAVCELADPGLRRWVLYGVSWSYSGTPTGGNLSITWSDGGVAYTESYAVLVGGPGQLVFAAPKVFPTGSSVKITLDRGGAGIYGTVYPIAQAMS